MVISHLNLFYLINTPWWHLKTADNVFSTKVVFIALLNTTALLRDTTESEQCVSSLKKKRKGCIPNVFVSKVAFCNKLLQSVSVLLQWDSI